ncbi:hypothetical protein [Cytobacillus oceanisediminis]|uniref:hypothetical protein n=1 Tax=Cytobacillus oceanisediminis TaxID=665099 RepID=UPI003734EE77
MANIQKIREIVSKAQELQASSTSEYRKLQDYHRQEISKIRSNKDFTETGKEKLMQTAKQKTTIRFLNGAREARKQYDSHLSEAKKLAKDLIYSKTPKLDDEVVGRFTRDFNEIKTAIMLSNPQKGKELLENFLKDVNEPALAEMVKNQFAEVIQPILSGANAADAGKYRRDLLDSFEQLKVRSMDPEARDAIQVLDYVDAALNSKFFNLAVEQAIGENLGRTAKDYMHKPHEYFELHPEHDNPQAYERTVDDIIAENEATM